MVTRINMRTIISFIVFLCASLSLLFMSACSKRSEAKFSRVVFITIDTLRADHFKSYGYFRETAPFIEQMIQNGVLFENAFSASSHTGPSHASMFTSVFPHQHGLLRNHELVNPELMTMPKFFQQNGYEVAGFSAVNFMEGKVGFEMLPEELELQSAKITRQYWFRPAQMNVNRVLHWFNKKGNPNNYFIWLHFYDVHEWDSKRAVPDKYRDRFANTDKRELVDFITTKHNTPLSFFKKEERMNRYINSYDTRIAYVDGEIKRLHDNIKDRGLLDNSLWVITADHGEGLGTHNYKGHGEFLYNEQLHVPLIFYSNNKVFKSRRVKNLVRSVDIFPTLRELSNVSNVPALEGVMGVSLKPLLLGEKFDEDTIKYSFSERRPKDMISFRKKWEEGDVFSVQDLEHKYVHHTQGQSEFYDLTSDPFEERSLSRGLPDLKKSLQLPIAAMLNFLKDRGSVPDAPKLSKDELEELKSLGYM